MNRRMAITIFGTIAMAALTACGGARSDPVANTSGTRVAPAQLMVLPASVQTAAGGSFRFLVSVLPAGASDAVTWSVSGSGCSGGSCGTIDNSGQYLAPAAVPVPPTITVTATSAADQTKSGTATVTIDPPAQSAGTFTLTGNMVIARAEHTATVLLDGTVLITGGYASDGQTPLRSAELYDSATGVFTLTGSMLDARAGHTATLLADGKVLVAGGNDANAELYDPATGTFTATGATHGQQGWQMAALLANGKVLVAGSPDAELYDPTTGTFVLAGPYASSARGFTATLLLDGRVLFVGDNPAQLYDPATDSFSLTGSLISNDYQSGTSSHTATLLRSGMVLVAGGMNGTTGDRFADAELYDPTSGMFTPASSMTSARDMHTATLLPDGRVLIAGGDGWSCGGGHCYFTGSLASAELYDPSTGSFRAAADMQARRTAHQATLLRNGEVLITGGFFVGGIARFYGSLASAELYHPRLSTSSPDSIRSTQ